MKAALKLAKNAHFYFILIKSLFEKYIYRHSAPTPQIRHRTIEYTIARKPLCSAGIRR